MVNFFVHFFSIVPLSFSIQELSVILLQLLTASLGIIIQIGVDSFLEQMKYRLGLPFGNVLFVILLST